MNSGPRAESLALCSIMLTKDDKFNPEEAPKGDWIEIPQAADLNDKLALTWGSIKSFQY